MLSVVNIQESPKWQISGIVTKKREWKISRIVTKLKRSSDSIRRITASSQSNSLKPQKQVRFSGKTSECNSPYSKHYLLEHSKDLWYSKEECRDLLVQDVSEVMAAGVTASRVAASGLKLHMVSERESMIRKRTIFQYRRFIVAMTRGGKLSVPVDIQNELAWLGQTM